MMRIILYSLLILLSATAYKPAVAIPIVADLSNYRIDIDAHFIGTRLFLFGAQNENGDLVVVVRGPKQKYTVRRKERIAGIWVNRRYVEFEAAPEFYAIASNKPIASLTHTNLIEKLGLGSETLLRVKYASSHKLDTDEFKKAFMESQYEKGLYNEPRDLHFMGDSLFKTTLEFPDTIPKGDYHAEIYLMQDDRLVATQSIPIKVQKVGIDGMITTLAHESPALYGIIAILIALSSGWIANRVFQRL